MADVGDLLKGIAAALWVVLALLVFLSFRKALGARLPFLTKLGLTPTGVSMEFAQQKLDEATGKTKPEARRAVTQATKRAVLNRVERNADLLGRARVLWVDDHPENNRPIVDLLDRFGAVVETPRSNAAALELMDTTHFHVVLSDVGRDDEGPESSRAGVRLAEEVYRRTHGQKTILFTARFDPLRLPDATEAERLELARTVSRVVSGRTNRYDEVLHLILDTLERTLL
jgi:CheY-like chemotaxis protein